MQRDLRKGPRSDGETTASTSPKILLFGLFWVVPWRIVAALPRRVTPEVPGSSPVAPVKALHRQITLPVGRRVGADYTRFSRSDGETAKNGPNAVAGRRFQADSGRVRAAREDAVRLHEETGGHGLGPSKRARAHSRAGARPAWTSKLRQPGGSVSTRRQRTGSNASRLTSPEVATERAPVPTWRAACD